MRKDRLLQVSALAAVALLGASPQPPSRGRSAPPKTASARAHPNRHVNASLRRLPLSDGISACADESMMLTVGSGPHAFRQLYCSAYQHGDVRTIRDERGRDYVLLRHAEGHGTRATRHFLTVYRFEADGLWERARLLLSEPIGREADWGRDEVVETPRGGGLRLLLRGGVEGTLEPGVDAPSPDRLLLAIDTR